MAQYRRAERRDTQGDFADCPFESLKVGDVFKLYDAEDEPLGTFRALGNAVPQPPEGNFGITCEPVAG